MEGSFSSLRIPQCHDFGAGRGSRLRGKHNRLDLSERITRFEGGDPHLKFVLFVLESADAGFKSDTLGVKAGDSDREGLVFLLETSDCRRQPGSFIPEQGAANGQSCGDRPWHPAEGEG